LKKPSFTRGSRSKPDYKRGLAGLWRRLAENVHRGANFIGSLKSAPFFNVQNAIGGRCIIKERPASQD